MNGLLVMQSDFGLSDGAVSAMCGVVLSVDDKLRIYHLTHDIPPFDTFEASYRLMQAVPFWPEGTVFVTVVDPGVGSSRKNIVAKTKRGQYIVTPDNGSLSHISRAVGIESVRVISERIGRRQNSEQSYTFLGRDTRRILRLNADDILDLCCDPVRFCTRQIDLIDDRHDIEVMINREVGIGQRLRLHALRRIDHEDGTVARGKAARNLIVEIHMSRRIDQIENIFLSIVRMVNRTDCLGLDRDTALTLQIHIIQHLILHLSLRQQTGLLDNTIGQSRFAVINMGDNTEISDMILIYFQRKNLQRILIKR